MTAASSNNDNGSVDSGVNRSVLVVGGGIAGIQASLEIADSGHTVYLVEREPNIGGRMAQLDKTFPTLDCSSCIFTPKTSQVGSNKNIKLMSYSEVVEVSGQAGNFKAKVKKKARYVDVDICTGCTECERICPVTQANEWQIKMTTRKATYRAFPQAIPNAFTIDKRGLPPCRATCPAGVNAQGYVALIAVGKYKEAQAVLRRTMPFAGVCGRVCTHLCESECERGKVDQPIAIRSLKRFMADYEMKEGREKATPIEPTHEKKVAVIGSGPAGIGCAYDLVQLGYPVTVFEAAPEAGGLLRYGIPEYRLPNSIVDDEIAYVQEMGVEIKTSNPVTDIDDLFKQGFSAVFLATGAGKSQQMDIPGEDSTGVLNALDFLKEANSGGKVSLGKKVTVVGGGNAAIDAARMASRLGAEVSIVYRRSRTEMPAAPEEIKAAEEEGIIINILTNPVKVLASGGTVSGIECVKMELGEPDESGRRRPVPVKGSEFTIDIDTVIMAIGQTVNKDQLPQKLEFTDWGTLDVDPVTLQTNLDGVFAGGDVASGPADVIKVVAAGKEAAISIDRFLQKEDLKEGRPVPRERVKDIDKEGVILQARQEMPELEPAQRTGQAEVELGFDEEAAKLEANRCLNCAGCSECMECVKACEPKAIFHDMQDEYIDLEVGAIIVTTGYDLFDPSIVTAYGYGKYDNVVTSLEFERMCSATGPTEGNIILKDGSTPDSVAIIHCVGSRDENYNEYCSRVCCMYGLKHAHLIKDKLGEEVQVYQMYIDMRCFGKGYEEFYKRISGEGINFIRGKPTLITDIATTDEEKGKLVVVAEDTLMGKLVRVPVEMVILSVAIEPRADAEDVAGLFHLNRSEDGFMEENDQNFDPLGTQVDGIFIAGCCQGPKDIPDTVAQAAGAAAKALALITRGEKRAAKEAVPAGA